MKFETYCGINISLVSCHGPIKDEIVMRSHIQTDEKSFALGKKYDSNKKTYMFGTVESDFGNNIFL